jgi:hypothetical protein
MDKTTFLRATRQHADATLHPNAVRAEEAVTPICPACGESPVSATRKGCPYCGTAYPWLELATPGSTWEVRAD